MSSQKFCCLLCYLVVVVAYSGPEPRGAPAASEDAPTLFEGARLIVGDASTPIEDAAFVVDNGKIARVGRKGEIESPPGAVRIDLTGKTVMPTLVSLHVHLGYLKGTTFSADNYTRENIIDELNRHLYYGIGAVHTAGTDPGDIAYRLREEAHPGALLRTAGRGFAAPNAGPGGETMRGAPYGITTEEEGRQAVRELAARKADFVKIWVDDRGGTVKKLTPNLYGAIIDEAHKHDIPVMAHVFYLEDAQELVRAGVNGFIHSIRDGELPDALIVEMKQRNMFITPNLGGTWRGTHAEKPPLIDDPLLAETVSRDAIKQLAGTFVNRDPQAVEQARDRYRKMQRSLAKLSAAGVTIALGADTGIPGSFQGYTEQVELERMVSAGMTPAQVIVAATSVPARLLRLDQMGTLAPGKSADFIVLDANPLEQIANSRKIAAVYQRGHPVDREALRRAWADASRN